MKRIQSNLTFTLNAGIFNNAVNIHKLVTVLAICILQKIYQVYLKIM